jgi:hypothetical protein
MGKTAGDRDSKSFHHTLFPSTLDNDDVFTAEKCPKSI